MSIFKMFVYGTLMKGYRNYNKYLDGHVISVKEAYIEGKLYHLDNENCPALVEGNSKIYGQILEVVDDENKSIQNAVDDLENYFAGNNELMYDRKLKIVYYEDGDSEEIGVYIFVNENYLKQNPKTLVDGGDWRAYIED